jgi:hypothetical protein
MDRGDAFMLGLFSALVIMVITSVGFRSCTTGIEGGQCYPNGTCNEGLTCLHLKGVDNTCAGAPTKAAP